MKLLVLVLCLAQGLALPRAGYEFCSPAKCKLPNCLCADEYPPISGKIPQFVVASFSDSMTKIVQDNLVTNFLSKYKNPDGCPVSATFYVSHKYTDYSAVNEVRNAGYEIASNSITKTQLSDYWRNISMEDTIAEMGGQREALSKFANIKMKEVTGGLIPMLQLNEFSFQSEKACGLDYDGSWPSMKPYFPYTLDFDSPQQCNSYNCKDTPVPGFWIIPIIDWKSQTNSPCNSIQGCIPSGTADEIFEWMKGNFERHYNGSRAPFNLISSTGWIMSSETNKESLKKFMEYLTSKKDVYLVSNRQLLSWMQDPKETFNSCQKIEPVACEHAVCPFQHNDEFVYMVVCGECPKNYPWLHNPLGD